MSFCCRPKHAMNKTTAGPKRAPNGGLCSARKFRARLGKPGRNGRFCAIWPVVHPDRAHLLECETGWAMREEIARIVPFYEGIQGLKKTGDAIQYGGAHLCA